jgi:Lactate racemase N-terminal domain
LQAVYADRRVAMWVTTPDNDDGNEESMEIAIRYGESEVVVRADADRLVPVRRQAEPHAVADPANLVSSALESPVDFPPLRQALTPDDHVAIVVDAGLPDLESLLVPIVEHICAAGVIPGRITVVVASLPDEYPNQLAGVTVERHDPEDRNRLAYVATTAGDRRVYLNRTVVEADQVVVLTEVRHDPRGGLTGGPAALFPELSDAATRAELRDERSAKTADEAKEVCWLLGMQFCLSVIAGAYGGIHAIISGPLESLTLARKAIKNNWVGEADRTADLVIASLNGAATMVDFAAALTHASGIAEPGGIIVLLTDASPNVGSGLSGVCQSDSPAAARKQLDAEIHEDYREAVQWLRAVHRHRVMVQSRWEDDLVEDLFATPIQNASQIQRLIDAADHFSILPDANRLFARVPSSE